MNMSILLENVDRSVLVSFCINVIGVDTKKAKKSSFERLKKTISEWEDKNPKDRVVRGSFVLGWRKGTKVVACKYYQECFKQTKVELDSGKRVWVYKKLSTALEKLNAFKKIDPTFYAGVTVISI